MNFENGFRVSQPNELQFNGCWVPATPQKPPSSGRSNAILENPQFNHSEMDHWLPQTPSYDFFAPNFDPNLQTGWVPGRFTVGESAAEQNPTVPTEWNDVPLLQLLLQGDSDAGALMPDLLPQTSSFRGDCMFDGFGSSLGFGSVVDNGHCQIGEGRAVNFSSVDHRFASEQLENGRSLHQTVQYDFSRSSMINYDLNVPPTMESQSLTSANSAHFTPATPHKDLATENHRSDNFVQKSIESQLQCGEASQNIVDLSSKNYEDSNKIIDLGIDLNETPQQKTPKRRKHRPKVIVEGKPKRTPKNTALNSTEPKAKRKYVRKNVLKDSTAQEEVDTIKESTEPDSEKAQKSCKRVLVFDLEDENQSGLGTMLSVPMQNPKRFSRENQIVSEKVPNGFVALLKEQEARRPVASGTGNGHGKASTVNFNEMDLEKVKKLMQSVIQPIPNTPIKSYEQRGSKRDYDQTIGCGNLYTTNYVASLLNSNPISDPPMNSQNRRRVSEGEDNTRILHTGDLYAPSVASTLQIVPSNPNSYSQGTESTKPNAKPVMNKKTALSGPESQHEQAPRRKGRAKKPTYATIMDDIMDRFQILDLNGNGNGDGLQKRDQNALVLFKGNGVLVPYEDDFMKKRKLRPKVDLDPESNRIWNLLMCKEGSDEMERNDEKKEKWWEEERKVFRGRVDSFIARMHLVQGDRRFSRWKGSVVDSVIGVFLTQNVSDHLSSSAFMSMAARFPLKPSNNNTQEETANIIDLESPIAVETPNDALRWYEHGNKPNITPSEEELILSQESCDSSITQVAGGIRSSSGSNSETEDPSNAYNPRSGHVSALTDILRTEKDKLNLDTGTTQNLGYSSSTVPNNPEQWWRETFSEESISSWQSPASESTKLVEKSNDQIGSSDQSSIIENTKNLKPRKGNPESRRRSETDWDELRKQVEANCTRKERRKDATDSLDYEAVRNADVREISDAIKERGMNNMLAERMKEFLNRIVKDHGSIDLEWLRDVPPDKAKDYLLSVRGLGLKSVECVRLLTLHHLAFPVDTNVGRIAVRLGWVPLQPLPESLQLHLLELYPILETIQKYLWPRLCKLDQRTLYELHYQMITFGKVFCTKTKPNCNACPMRGECRHFASAFASARLALPGPEERHIVSSAVPQTSDKNPSVVIHPMAGLPAPQHGSIIEIGSTSGRICEPIIEEPASPEQERTEISESDIEDSFYEDPDEIPTIKLDMGELRESLQNYMEKNMELQEADMSKALVALTPDVASLPIPKLKYVNRLRTEHQVYELPDSHPLLERMERREPDDPSPYLLAIWTPGETANSIQPPERSCGSEPDKVCDDAACFSCNSVREANSQTVRGTILIPCRTAMRGSFPLNGTYFQVNELFADHASSLSPIDVPRGWIWNLPRRMVYFGTSVSSIFKGLTTEGIQYCFWKGFVCVRGFDLETRAPRPLKARLHFPVSKLAKNKQDEKRKKGSSFRE